MVVGAPGAPFPPAAEPVEEETRHGQESAIILHHPLEELSVLEKQPKQTPATQKNVPTVVSSW